MSRGLQRGRLGASSTARPSARAARERAEPSGRRDAGAPTAADEPCTRRAAGERRRAGDASVASSRFPSAPRCANAAGRARRGCCAASFSVLREDPELLVFPAVAMAADAAARRVCRSRSRLSRHGGAPRTARGDVIFFASLHRRLSDHVRLAVLRRRAGRGARRSSGRQADDRRRRLEGGAGTDRDHRRLDADGLHRRRGAAPDRALRAARRARSSSRSSTCRGRWRRCSRCRCSPTRTSGRSMSCAAPRGSSGSAGARRSAASSAISVASVFMYLPFDRAAVRRRGERRARAAVLLIVLGGAGLFAAIAVQTAHGSGLPRVRVPQRRRPGHDRWAVLAERPAGAVRARARPLERPASGAVGLGELDQQPHPVAGGALADVRRGRGPRPSRRCPGAPTASRRRSSTGTSPPTIVPALRPSGALSRSRVVALDQLVVLLVQRQPPDDLAAALAGCDRSARRARRRCSSGRRRSSRARRSPRRSASPDRRFARRPRRPRGRGSRPARAGPRRRCC